MRALIRLPEPQILIDKGTKWLNNLLLSGNSRPDSSKYGNPNIKLQLKSMSFHKYFYCESKLKDKPSEIDHHIEVAVDISLSYTWTNLYLSCDNCNDKLSHNTIPINQALDPCVNSNEEIQDHLTFVDEIITAKNSSILGLNTIRKYRLDTDLLEKRRITQLKNFYKLLESIRTKQIEEGGRTLNSQELSAINHFKQEDQPYSLMFKIIIDKII
ncbi:MAG: HNH endonuclease [Janthinobacterium lividum]